MLTWSPSFQGPTLCFNSDPDSVESLFFDCHIFLSSQSNISIWMLLWYNKTLFYQTASIKDLTVIMLSMWSWERVLPVASRMSHIAHLSILYFLVLYTVLVEVLHHFHGFAYLTRILWTHCLKVDWKVRE